MQHGPPRWLGHTNSLHSAGRKNQGAFSETTKTIGCRLHGGLDSFGRPSPSRVRFVRGLRRLPIPSVRYETQLEWKRNQVKDSFERIGGMEIEVEPVEPSPEPMDIGPSSHHTTRGQIIGKEEGRLPQTRIPKVLIDVPQCPIATEAINDALPAARRKYT